MDITARLPKWLSQITSPTIPVIQQEMRKWNLSYLEVSPHLSSPVPPLHYGRKVLARFPLFEVIVLHVPPQVETPIHDHGNSFCCVQVIDGILCNRIYEIQPSTDTPIQVREETYRSNDFFAVTKDQFHSMYNPTSQPLITFHIYSPPIENNRIYQDNHIQNPILP